MSALSLTIQITTLFTNYLQGHCFENVKKKTNN